MPTWEVKISHDGIWPFKWRWSVVNKDNYDGRYGEALTKDRARRKAVEAKQSMETEDVRVVYEPERLT